MAPLILAETSKVPFYILGGAFAVYAVILAAIGMRRPNFPGARGERVVIAISLLMLVLALGAAIATA